MGSKIVVILMLKWSCYRKNEECRNLTLVEEMSLDVGKVVAGKKDHIFFEVEFPRNLLFAI